MLCVTHQCWLIITDRVLKYYIFIMTKKNDDELRHTGFQATKRIPWGTHFCQFYETTGDMLQVLLPYFKAGLENNEKCIWITSEFLDTDMALHSLKKYIPGFSKFIDKRQIEILPHNRWYLRKGIFEMKRVLVDWVGEHNKALSAGYSGLRVSGNPFWLESKKEWDDFIAYESEINKVIDKYKLIVLCTYSLNKCSSRDVIDVVTNHEFALIKRQGKWKRIENVKNKKIEQELHKKEAMFKKVVDASPYAIYLAKGLDQKAEYVNPRFVKLFGYTLKDVPTVAHWYPLAYPDPEYRRGLVEEWERRIKKVYKSGKSIKPMEATAVCKDGSKKHILWSYVNIKDTNISYGIDLTESKKAEEKIRTSEMKFKTIFENSPTNSVLASIDGRLLMANKKAVKMLGFKKKKEFMGKNLIEFIDPKYHEKISEGWKKILKKGSLSNLETVWLKKDGGKITALVSGVVLKDNNGKEGSVLVMVQDITELKNSEVALKASREDYKIQLIRLKAILDSTPAIIWIAHDAKCKTISGNRAAYKFSKVKIGENLSKTGQIVNKLKHYDIYEKGIKLKPSEMPLQRVAASGKPLWDYELEFVFENGGRRTLMGNVVPILGIKNKPAGAVAAFVDITYRKQLEDRKDDFIDIASHELKTPLTSLKAYAQIISGKYNNSKNINRKYVLTRMQSQIDKLVHLVNQMLDVTKIQSGKLLLNRENFNLDALIDEVIKDLKIVVNNDAGKKQKNFKFIFEKRANMNITGDYFRLSQVVVNLLTNAVKYSKNSLKIVIETKKINNELLVSIKDFGIGIPKKQQNHLFERFYQVGRNNYLQNKFTSLGLGLYISYNIVNQHRGRMWFKSVYGKGSTFYFALPS